jgi:XRE family transcriptional regulator of biofilm formation
MVRIGRRVKQLRTRLGWSQRDLARRAHIRQAYVCQLERGQRSNPSIDVLRRLAAALAVSVSDLVE